MVMPLLGQTMEEGTITKWLKKEGDAVEKGEPILEVMTDKANMEVEAPVSGVLRKILAVEEQIVPIKDPIAIIGKADEPIDDLLGDGAPAAAAPVAEAAAPSPAQTAPAAPVSAEAPVPNGDRVFSSPRARMVAEEKNVDINMLAGRGTGPGGRIVEKDVLDFLAAAPTDERLRATPLAGKVAADLGVDLGGVAATGISGRITRDDVMRTVVPQVGARPDRVIPLAGMRKAVADNVSRSARTAPHVTLVSEVDMSECVKLRKQILPEVEKTHGVKISFTDIIIKAVARAIDDFPIVNATLENDQITIHGEINVGVAVALPDGLIVPVVRDARSKGIAQISIEVKQLAEKARSGSLTPNEYQGGTFTISNLGTYGVDVFNPIINPPQVAILGVCRIVEKPIAVGGQVEVRPTMNLCLSFDHRAMDGAPAAEYLARLKHILENPYLLFV